MRNGTGQKVLLRLKSVLYLVLVAQGQQQPTTENNRKKDNGAINFLVKISNYSADWVEGSLFLLPRNRLVKKKQGGWGLGPATQLEKWGLTGGLGKL